MKQVFESDIKQYIEKTVKLEFGRARDFNFDFGPRLCMVDFYYDYAWNIWRFARIQDLWNKLGKSFPKMTMDNMWVDGSHITLRVYFDSGKGSIFN